MYSAMRKVATALLLAALATALSTCGGKSSGHATLVPKGGPASNPPGPVSLPSPSSLPLERSTAFTEGGIMRQGSAYETVLPSSHVAAAAPDATFSPSFGATGLATGLAYAIY